MQIVRKGGVDVKYVKIARTRSKYEIFLHVCEYGMFRDNVFSPDWELELVENRMRKNNPRLRLILEKKSMGEARKSNYESIASHYQLVVVIGA